MIYYRRYIGAYVKRTTRLSMRDHGAYCLMLDFYYAEEQPLPLELEDIYDICRARTPDDRKSADKVLRLFFQRRDDSYHNQRADDELAASQQARTNGKKGGRPKTDDITGSGTGTITEPVTGSEPGDKPERKPDAEPEGTGSGHPSSFNHSAFQPFSLSTDQPSTDSAAANRNANPPPHRAAAIAVLIRNLEKQRGKAPKITSALPLVQQWAEQGITDQQITEAYEIAIADREAADDGAPINAGFLDVFIAKMLNPKAQQTRINGHRKPWYADTWQAIVAKGAEKGLSEADFDSPPAFKAAVFKAHGITAEDVRKAELDYA